MRFKAWWKSKPYWLRGGILSLILVLFLYAKNTTTLLSGGLLRKPQIYWVVFWRAQKTAGGERSEHATSL